MRLLMIEDDARYCALIRHHLTCRWPDADLVVSSPVLHPIPAPEYVAQGFDAVLISHEWPGGRGIDWVKDFAGRPRVVVNPAALGHERNRRLIETPPSSVGRQPARDAGLPLHRPSARPCRCLSQSSNRPGRCRPARGGTL